MPIRKNAVIIIGSGPAGVSTSIYTSRAGFGTIVIGGTGGALKSAKEIENYYGFPDPISGSNLFERGLAQAKRLGVEVYSQEVVGIEDTPEGFTVKTVEAEFFGEVAVLATGASRTKPKWPGVDKFNGMGISYCAICDAFFFRGKDVAVAGNGAYALHEAQALLPLVNSVTLCTDGEELTADFPPEIKIIAKPVKSLEGEGTLSGVRFEDDSAIEVNALFVAIGTAGSAELAASMGAAIEYGSVVVDARMQTSIPKLLAVGDCTGGMKQIAKAVYEGALAGTEAIRILRGQ